MTAIPTTRARAAGEHRRSRTCTAGRRRRPERTPRLERGRGAARAAAVPVSVHGFFLARNTQQVETPWGAAPWLGAAATLAGLASWGVLLGLLAA